jgi:hypothetical protein
MDHMLKDDLKQDVETRCRNEVIELHRFFEDWYNGVIEESDEQFSRLEMALGEGFLIISPDGRKTARKPLLTSLRRLHASHCNDPSPFRIWIGNVTVRPLTERIVLVTYEEWQENDGERKGRLSSALFRNNAKGPNGLEWLHVHETWLRQEES